MDYRHKQTTRGHDWTPIRGQSSTPIDMLSVAPSPPASPMTPIPRLKRPPRLVMSETINGSITPMTEALIPSSVW